MGWLKRRDRKMKRWSGSGETLWIEREERNQAGHVLREEGLMQMHEGEAKFGFGLGEGRRVGRVDDGRRVGLERVWEVGEE